MKKSNKITKYIKKETLFLTSFNAVGKSSLCSILIAVLISLTCQVYAQNPASFTSNNKNINVEAFNEKVNHMIGELGVPGLSLAVIEDNQVVFSNYYGKKALKDNQDVDKETVFEAASLTKMYLVYVVHKLVEKKLLDLDKPMYTYLEYQPLSHDERYKLITPKMILSHSSGIENWRWHNQKDLLEIVSNPGEKFVYSGEGFQYLAKVVEVILKESYQNYITKMVLEPFDLNQTYLKFKKMRMNPLIKEIPSNYAVGYTIFNDQVDKWKNYETVPASGAHTTAKDYAKFIISFFNKNNLSDERVKDIIKPIIWLDDNKLTRYMGAGFFTVPNKNDTIVSFSGNNDGFKAELFYSVTNKRGFVFFTNSDQGKLITREINKMTTDFNVDFLFEEVFFKYYPSYAITFQKKYREGNAAAVLKELEQLKKSGKLDESTLNELGEIFKDKEPEMAIQLLKENIELYPKSPNAYGLLASIYLNRKEYELAHLNFVKAKELNFNLWNVEEDIKSCQEKL